MREGRGRSKGNRMAGLGERHLRAPLQMTHPSRMSAFLGRTLDFEREPLKSLVTRKDVGGVAHVIL
jgi:hypothetical protein